MRATFQAGGTPRARLRSGMGIRQGDVIYFVLTDRFYGTHNPAPLPGMDRHSPVHFHGGNFDGIIEKIPYLVGLGITALWITPVYVQVPRDAAAMQPYHGYWPLDFDRVDPHLYLDHGRYEPGSRRYLRDLVDALHAAGIKLVLDVVVNHAGYGHPGHSGQEPNPTPIRPSWFNRPGLSSDVDVIEGELCGLPDFDLDNVDAVDYHIESLLAWARETGLDALRMDTAKHIERSFWQYFKTQVRGSLHDLTLLGEALVFDVDELTEYQKLWGFDSLFDFPVEEMIKRVFVHGQSLTNFRAPFDQGTGIFDKDTRYGNQNRLVSLLDNHDLPARFMTEAMRATGGDRERAARILKLALAFMFTTRGTPQLYYGTEIAMEGGADPDNRRDFEWEKIGPDGAVKDEYPIEKAVFEHTRQLIRLRKEHAALHAGMFVCLFVDYFLMVQLAWVGTDVVIAAYHNGWEPMPSAVRVQIANNHQIPRRVAGLLEGRTLTCGLSGAKVTVTSGEIELRLDGKSAMVLV
jgi:glycosidase